MAGRQVEKPPRWALGLLVAGLAALIALVPVGMKRGLVDPSTRSGAGPTVAQSSGGLAPIAIVMGDSWSEGAGADSPSGTYPEQVASAQGWRLINASQGGTGYVTDGPEEYPKRAPLPDRVADVVAQDPAVVIVAAGLNDAERGYTEQRIRAGVEATLRPLTEQLPDALVAVVGPFWPNEEPTPSVLLVDEVIQEVTEELGVPFVSPIQDRWITGTDDGTPLGNRAQFIATGSGGAHPTQAGHDYLAVKVQEFLAGIPDVPGSL
ncbi:SGNH/GDSL hydrolase family protein [Geodermatophilus sp. SYSU D00684]